MSPLRINNKTARQLWLSSQGLGSAPTGPLNVMQIIKDLGFVQLDSIQIVSRAHHHILWSRNQNYREPMLDRLLGKDRQIFEHFTHDASVLPMEFLPMWKRQFDRQKARLGQGNWYKGLPNKAERAKIKERIRAEGALSTKAFDTKIKGPKEMWSRPPHKLALDYMWYTGELATCHRENFNKFYDLAERIFPRELHTQNLPEADQINWLCHAALKRMGFGSAGDLKRYWDAVSTQEAKAWIEHSASELQAVEIETAEGTWVEAYALNDITHRIETLKPTTNRLRILNPFDPVIRDRARLSRLFGFDYRVEMFVPAAKRKWGYYVFPILEANQFVGRIEAKADRKKSKLTVTNFWPEDRVTWTPRRDEKLAKELDRMRRFIGVEKIIWSR